jgi:hypothetical protein
LKIISGSDFLRENSEVRAACKAAVLHQKVLRNQGMHKHAAIKKKN